MFIIFLGVCTAGLSNTVRIAGKFLRIAHFCPAPKDAVPPNFANSHKTVKFTKVFFLESFLLYGTIGSSFGKLGQTTQHIVTPIGLLGKVNCVYPPLTLKIKKFRCYETKIEQSEKAGSRTQNTSGLSCQSRQFLPIIGLF